MRVEADMAGAGGPEILLVEDLPLHRRIIPLRLGPWGVDIAVVDDAEAAEVYLKDHHPSLILLDVILPGKDGFTLCRELKGDPRTRDIAIMMLTELQDNAFELSVKAMADDYFPKRAQDIVLRTRVHLHLQLQGLRQAGANLAEEAAPGIALLATESRAMRAQLPLEAHLEGHFMQVVERLEDLVQLCRADDHLLVVDTSLGVERISEQLVQLRSNPATEGMAILLLCEKTELSVIPGLLALVDDVLWKPMKPSLARQRMHLLMELGRRRMAVLRSDPVRMAELQPGSGSEFPFE
jgi:DNA-binding response OmpR family regulator